MRSLCVYSDTYVHRHTGQHVHKSVEARGKARCSRLRCSPPCSMRQHLSRDPPVSPSWGSQMDDTVCQHSWLFTRVLGTECRSSHCSSSSHYSLLNVEHQPKAVLGFKVTITIIQSFPRAVQRGAVTCLQSHSMKAAKYSPQSSIPEPDVP